MIEADRVTELGQSAELVNTPSESGSGQLIARCHRCKVALWSNYSGAGPIVKFVRVGTLDNPDLLPPDIHIFTASKQPWVVLPEGTPAVAEYYDRELHWPRDSLTRRRAILPLIEAYQAAKRGDAFVAPDSPTAGFARLRERVNSNARSMPMRLSTMMLLLSALSTILAGVGLWTFYTSFDPIPEHLVTFSGTARNVSVSRLLYSKSHATFDLEQSTGEAKRFSYSPMFNNFFYFADNLHEGSTVEVVLDPRRNNDFWGLKLDAKTLMTPTEARDARLINGRWGVVMCAFSIAGAMWFAHLCRASRRQGI